VTRNAAVIGVMAALLACAPLALDAQQLRDPKMPVPHSSVRQRQLERPVAMEGSAFPMYEVWWVGAQPEMLLGWYLGKLNTLSPVKNGVLDTADVRLGETRPMSYRLTFHTFKDVCADSGATTPDSGGAPRPCTRWLRGEDKRKLLENNRSGYEMGLWIEAITFTWLNRETTGELVRRQIDVRDAGISKDWKRYTLRTQITLERDVLQKATQ